MMKEHDSKNLISVIMPVYNAEKYVKRALDSILNQTLREIEVLCVDDGSTDQSLGICQEYAAKDSRIKVFHKENSGSGAARNVGLRHADAEYITFIDVDDWIEPEMYAILYSQAVSCNADISIIGYTKDTGALSEEMVNKQSIEKCIYTSEELIRYAFIRDEYKNFGAYVWNKLFKRSLLLEKENEILFDEKPIRGDDVHFYAQAALRAKNAVYSDKCMYHYVQREDSFTHAILLEKDDGILRAYEMIIKLCEENNITEDTIRWIRRFYAYHASLLAERAIKVENREKLLEYKNAIRKYLADYIETNRQYPERIARIESILGYGEK